MGLCEELAVRAARAGGDRDLASALPNRLASVRHEAGVELGELDPACPHGRRRGREIAGDLDPFARDGVEEPGRLLHKLGEIHVYRLGATRRGVFAQLIRHAGGAQRGVADGVQPPTQTLGISRSRTVSIASSASSRIVPSKRLKPTATPAARTPRLAIFSARATCSSSRLCSCAIFCRSIA